jgi:hypothetical protein
LWDDGVADAAEEVAARDIVAGAAISQAEGRPINQALKAGFNTPYLVVAAVDETVGVPEARASSAFNSRPCWNSRERLFSCAVGLAHPASWYFVKADRSMWALLPSGILPVAETPFRTPLPPLPSLAPGLTHPARWHW